MLYTVDFFKRIFQPRNLSEEVFAYWNLSLPVDMWVSMAELCCSLKQLRTYHHTVLLLVC